MPIGFKVIKEMTREELIEEVLAVQRAQLNEMTIKNLRHNVADFRVAEMTKRIHAEAGVRILPGILGGTIVDEDDE